VDREAELLALERSWRSGEPVLALVSGRRRTGKTRLLGRFVERKRAVFYAAAQQASLAELRGLSRATREALRPDGGDLLALADFPDWERALEYLAEKARAERLSVVLDEFPYLVESEPALPSIIQRFWDHRGRGTRLFLVLCGSSQAVMDDLQVRRATLFGRIDLRLELRPFGYREAALFTPRLAPAEQAVAYGVLGGMPVYLQRWDDSTGHLANLRRLFADPTSPLVEEGEYVLGSELREASGYFRIMHAIAAGRCTYGAIRDFAQIDIARQLERLLAIGLVERTVPVTEDPTRTKRAVYRIADNFLSFWFRFIHGNRANIARGLGRELVDRLIVPGLSDHMGPIWEELCSEFIRGEAAAGRLPVELSSVGRWWNRDSSVEIDIVGLRGRQVVLAGSAKWSRTAGQREISALRRAAEALPRRADELVLALFARERVRELDHGALAFTAADLYGRSTDRRDAPAGRRASVARHNRPE
jgi:AAA+ ATPase superfamily predicted ATPase